jgi:glutathione S-transferase
MPGLELTIANKNYSSWSLRAWLHLKNSGIAFEERRVPLYTTEWDSLIASRSPSGRLPALRDGDVAVWDSWAIIEYARSKFPGAVGWPAGERARAAALSVGAEMHSGFMALRGEMPLNCRRRIPGLIFSQEAQEDVARVKEIWRECRREFGADGPWLFGGFTVADVMYAPVALRFQTYGVVLEGPLEAYAGAVLALPEVREWVAGAEAESEVLEAYERKP